jgi:hypothetical protein
MINNRVQRGYHKRNKLIHWTVAVFQDAAPGRRWVLQPLPILGGDGPPPPAVGVRDIVRYRNDFSALIATLTNFSHVLGQGTKWMKGSLERPAPPMTLDQIRDDLRAYCGCAAPRVAGGESTQTKQIGRYRWWSRLVRLGLWIRSTVRGA